MASFENLLYQQMKNDTFIAAALATFSGVTAIFEIQAPNDKDPGWTGKQYPRIVYSVDKREDPERKVSGTLLIDISTKGAIEDLEAQMRAILSNVFFETEEGVVATVWNNSAAFEEHDNVIGVTMTFDIFAFPVQLTEPPDPIQGLINMCVTEYPTAHLFNAPGGEVWAPSESEPAIYWRMSSIAKDSETNAVIWYNATINGHVFAPNPTARNKWLRKIVEEIISRGEVMLDDGSLMQITNVSADGSRDPLRMGQITLSTKYGKLRSRTPHGSTGQPLNHAIKKYT
jgi:hypothetical protein